MTPTPEKLAEAVERVREGARTLRATSPASTVAADLETLLSAIQAKDAALRRVQGITNELSWNTRTRPIANQLNLAMAQPAAQALGDQT